MTKEQKVSKRDEVRAGIGENVFAYNAAVQKGDLAEVKRLKSAIDDDIKEFNDLSQKICFDECFESDDPMQAAVVTYSYPAIKTKTKDDTLSIEDTTKQIDLLALHQRGRIGKDANWPYMISEFTYYLTAKASLMQGGNIKDLGDTYYEQSIVRAFNAFYEEEKKQGNQNPLSKKTLQRKLDSIVKAMLGNEYIAITHDIGYLLNVFTKKSSQKLRVTTATESTLVKYIMDVLHTKLTGAKYGIDGYKTLKKS